MNSDPSLLFSLQHLFIPGFSAEYEVEETNKEALAIAQQRWARIFKYNCPVAGRAHDPPDRKMLWGKLEDMSKHPDGEEDIQLWDVPRLTAMVTHVKAKLEAILGKTLHVMTQGYIESITHLRQLPHRDFPTASLPVDGIALSVCWALSMDVPDDDVCAQFVAMSNRGTPRPWIIHCMPMKRGSLWVMCHSGLVRSKRGRDCVGGGIRHSVCRQTAKPNNTAGPRFRSQWQAASFTHHRRVVQSSDAAGSQQVRIVLGVQSKSFAGIIRGLSVARASLKRQQKKHPIQGVPRLVIRVVSPPFSTWLPV